MSGIWICRQVGLYSAIRRMKSQFGKASALICAATLFYGISLPAQSLDRIGVTLLRAVTTNLDGSGIHVAQPEALVSDSPPSWEVDPGNFAQLAGRFTFTTDSGSTNGFPNSLGASSWHANEVGGFFYGQAGGVATNLTQVDNYDADFFITNYVFNFAPMPAAAVVNQSFTFGNVTNDFQPNGFYPMTVSDQQAIDSAYDDYADAYGILFVSAVNNQDSVSPPGTAYNSIGVAAYHGFSSVGPTLDNGRCKPDITAPSPDYTSFSTPLVSGAAALLMQAALRGDGGGDINSAFDLRTIKALLLNGAVKPADWTNSNSSPLDARYGAGLLNVFNSYEQLAGGKNNSCATNLIAIGTAHPPNDGTNTISSASGWNFQNLASSATNDAVNDYFFNFSGGAVTATLVWNRQLGQTNINDLDLFLFAAGSNLVACGTSRVDNVEHIFVPQLAAGRYDLQVLKNGGTNVVSDAENYALAWAFVSPVLSIVGSGTNAAVTWPVYPAGFLVEAATNLDSPVWSTNNLPSSAITNSRNNLTVSATNAVKFFRLRRPNF